MARKKALRIEDKIERLNKWLPVRLSPTQLLERATKAANLIKERADVEADKAARIREYGEKIKELAGEISRLSQIVASGSEFKNVECEVRRSYLEKRVITVREDTGEIVDDRKMFESEMQGDLPFPADALDGDTSAAVDESELEPI